MNINLHKTTRHILLINIFFIVFLISSYQLIADHSHSLSINDNMDPDILRTDHMIAEGKFEEAINLLESYLKNPAIFNNKTIIKNAIYRLGLLYWNVGDLNNSFERFSQLSTLSAELMDNELRNFAEKALLIHDHYKQGKSYRTNGFYSKAIDSFNKAITLSREIKSIDLEVKCQRLLSLIYWDTTSYSEFMAINQLALNLAKKIAHKREEGICLNNIGLCYWKMDNYSLALKNFDNALTIALSLNDIQGEINCLNNIGIIYKEQGEYDKALEYSSRTLDLDKQFNNFTSIPRDLLNIGAIYRKKGLLTNNRDEYEKALEYLQQCLALLRKEKSTSDSIKNEIWALNNIGTVYSDISKYSQAVEYFSKAYDLSKRLDDSETKCTLLTNMGIVHSNLGNYEESTALYEQAIVLALKIKGGQVLWEAYFEIGNTYRKQKQFEKALQYYENSIAVIEDIRSTINLEEYRADYLGTDKRIEVYNNMISLLFEISSLEQKNNHYQEAFNYLEKAKARAFLDSLEVSGVQISHGIDIKKANDEKELMREISRLYTKLIIPGISDKEKDEIAESLTQYEGKIEALKREIRTTSPAYANLKYPEVIKYQEAHETLVKGGDAYFAYSLGKEQSYCFVLKKTGLKVFPLPSRKILQEQVAEYRKMISNKDSKDFSLGYQLYRELILPGLSEEVGRIIILPDDILYLLPFETLISDPQKVQWLVQAYPVAYVPSFSSLRELKRRKIKGRQPQNNLLAFGDPSYGPRENGEDSFQVLVQDFYNSPVSGLSRLKHSGLEIKKIASVFKNSKTATFLREEATEEKFKSQKLDDYKIIHLATHGLIDDKNPARSSVILTLDPDPSEDGLLQMREIFNLKLNADLVSLSACQTGLGQFIRGEGIESLSRAFFYAGASSVLMSLWAVNDEATCQLMERFYYHLHAGLTFIEALQKVKLEMISSRPLSHPYYWASFILTGRADMAIYKGTFIRWILFIGLPLLGVTILLFLRRRLIKRT